jgi:hypothetical protein
MGEGLTIRQIIDRFDVEIASTESSAQDISTNSSKSVDTDFNHAVVRFVTVFPYTLSLGTNGVNDV